MMQFFRVSLLAGWLQLWASASAATSPVNPNANPPSLNVLSQELNITNPFTTTLLNISTSTSQNASIRDFPDPYDFIVGDNKLTIEFYGYQGTVNFAAMNTCVGAANRDITSKIMAGKYDEPMGAGPYVWALGDVTLYLRPGQQLTWGKWSLAPAAMKEFIRNNKLRGTQFILLWHELGPVGYGQLVTTSQAGSLPPITDTTNAFPGQTHRLDWADDGIL